MYLFYAAVAYFVTKQLNDRFIRSAAAKYGVPEEALAADKFLID